jgi:MOSC domain-containing protein YiiM
MERIGRVKAIYITPEQGNLDNPVSMQELESVQVIEGVGLVGDRYASGNGFWQNADNKKPVEKRKIRQISLISAEDIRSGNEENRTNIEESDTRRNIVVEGIENLQQFIGKNLVVGESEISVTGDCDACNRPSKMAKKDGFEKFGKRGGIRGKVNKTGLIRKNDDIFVL